MFSQNKKQREVDRNHNIQMEANIRQSTRVMHLRQTLAREVVGFWQERRCRRLHDTNATAIMIVHLQVCSFVTVPIVPAIPLRIMMMHQK